MLAIICKDTTYFQDNISFGHFISITKRTKFLLNPFGQSKGNQKDKTVPSWLVQEVE